MRRNSTKKEETKASWTKQRNAPTHAPSLESVSKKSPDFYGVVKIGIKRRKGIEVYFHDVTRAIEYPI